MLLFGFAIVTYATFCPAPLPLLGPCGGCQSGTGESSTRPKGSGSHDGAGEPGSLCSGTRISLMSVSLTPLSFR